jgi:hypothetical protein
MTIYTVCTVILSYVKDTTSEPALGLFNDGGFSLGIKAAGGGGESATRLVMRGATLPLLTCTVMVCTGTVLPFHAKDE